MKLFSWFCSLFVTKPIIENIEVPAVIGDALFVESVGYIDSRLRVILRNGPRNGLYSDTLDITPYYDYSSKISNYYRSRGYDVCIITGYELDNGYRYMRLQISWSHLVINVER